MDDIANIHDLAGSLKLILKLILNPLFILSLSVLRVFLDIGPCVRDIILPSAG